MSNPATDQVAVRRRWVKVLLALGCALMAAMWVYYLFFASDKGVYRLDDTSWRAEAAQVCAAAKADLAGLADTTGGFIGEPTEAQMKQRAATAEQATDIIEQMLDEIIAIPVDNGRDREILDVFEENYRKVIADRRRYAASLSAGENVRYTETVVAGGPVSNVITDFTAGVKSNDVPECSPPNDLVNTKMP